ncbi:MupA/Atu3671 family FMN-dependent luciferase-like monooxygenase [Saccharothrix longispora]|uniref:MupA/Atu3671 family FMN-dependent luciferase-like monooxygenase n=1 Tax=Saccharothrix longispora TaxID=33920 RepID=UPI0028FD4670|nr:MupA/Atu3671 family FMN-dependent luciferase-like monooxygenase [Saccharothrix longispora]MBY8848283.1 LLM class flavin-dependent oxidoreductase [Saccharothrix sp. MB29]MDU0289578.1 LLM class flavin-dependent oxidoreductase [Saccharothrix longispora]
MEFGVFFFSASGEEAAQTYRMVLAAARRADELGLEFVSTPERHFHPFGGAFPNPAVMSAAIAAVTERVRIRAGSVVTPLHPVARVVEDFAMVDCLSGGRVDIAIGSGWNVNDFTLAPAEYEGRRERVVDDIATIREVWRTGAWSGVNPHGDPVRLDVHPRPVGAELPIWTTASRSPETFRRAGELGTNLLTHLENQDLDALADKVDGYREARADHGWPGRGKVTLMLHTCVGASSAEAEQLAGPWLKRYLLTAIDLEAAAVRSGGTMSGGKRGRDFMSSRRGRDKLAELGVNRYLDGASLIGSVADCAEVVRRAERAGVDEIACLVDFIGDRDAVLAGVERIAELRRVTAGEAVVGR